MKIAWMHSHFLNWMGGHQYVYEICKRLSKKHRVSLITSAATSEATVRFRDIGVNFINLNRPTTNNPFYWILLPIYIKADLRSIWPHVTETEMIITSYFPAHLWAQGLQKPYIQILYEPLAFYYDQQLLSGFPLPVRWLFAISKFLYANWDIQAVRQAKKLLTLSQYNASWINRVYQRDDIEIVYEGVDTKIFRPLPDVRFEPKYQHKHIVFHSTDYTATKGTDLLFESLPQVIRKMPNVKVLVSETKINYPVKKKLIYQIKKLGISDKVDFLGKLQFSELPKYLSKANVVVQPSRNQSMSLTVKEAMACETPVITCLEGREQFRDGSGGFLVNPLNKDELSDRILKVLENQALAQEMGKQGRQIILEKFSWEAVTEKLLQAIKN